MTNPNVRHDKTAGNHTHRRVESESETVVDVAEAREAQERFASPIPLDCIDLQSIPVQQRS